MKITYDKQADVLYIKLSDKKVVESQETENNIVVDYDNENNTVGIEILYFIKNYKSDVFPVFKEVEKAVWEQTEILNAL